MTAVEARFAGGPITVGIADMSGVATVTLSMPGDSAGMFPSEARELAVALTAAAGDAEECARVIRRHRQVDDRLIGLDQ